MRDTCLQRNLDTGIEQINFPFGGSLLLPLSSISLNVSLCLPLSNSY